MTNIKRVSAVVIIIDDEIITLYKPEYDWYELPGGKIQDGETETEAAMREAREEIGCDVTLEGKVGVYDIVTPTGPKRISLYSARLNGEPYPAEPDTFPRLFRMPIDQVADYNVPDHIFEICTQYILKRHKKSA